MQKGKVPPQAIQRAVQAVRTLDDAEGTEEEQLQAADTLMELATDIHNKAAVREAGGVQCLLDLLDDRPEAPITNVAAEALACLAVGDAASRVRQAPVWVEDLPHTSRCVALYSRTIIGSDITGQAWKGTFAGCPPIV